MSMVVNIFSEPIPLSSCLILIQFFSLLKIGSQNLGVLDIFFVMIGRLLLLTGQAYQTRWHLFDIVIAVSDSLDIDFSARKLCDAEFETLTYAARLARQDCDFAEPDGDVFDQLDDC